MSTSDLQGRLKKETYDQDEVISFGVFEKGADPGSYVHVPESLVSRLIHLGCAYKLHVIQMIDLYEDIYLNGLQCQSLVEEIRFLGNIIDDQALVESLRPVMDLLSKIEKNSSLGLKVSGL